MQFVPDWAPNIHPLVIHFPVALLVIAVFLDGTSFFLLKHILSKSSLILYVLGTAGAIAAFITGKIAVKTVNPPLQAEITLGQHADWALYTMIFFILYTIARVIADLHFKIEKHYVKVFFFVLAVSGLYLLVRTGDMGAKLVFKYGVGQLK